MTFYDEWQKVGRDDPYYRACVAGFTAAGAVAGVITGSPTGIGVVPLGIAGGIMGFGAGYLACPYLAPKIKQKVQKNINLTEHELRDAAAAMSRYAGVESPSDALKLVAFVKTSRLDSGRAPICSNPNQTAKALLGYT